MKLDDIIKLVVENPYAAFFYTPLIYDNSYSYIFTSPAEVIPVYNKIDLENSLRLVDKYIANGLSGYCLINYEAGYLLEKKLEKFLDDDEHKLMQFFFFDEDNVRKIKSSKIEFENSGEEDYSITSFKLNTSQKDFLKNIAKIKNYIKEGETYQVNYTLKGKFRFSGSYSSFFKNLLYNQSAKYSAFINNGSHFILSLSPELFFELGEKSVTTKPMKGTMQRGKESKSDSLKASELKYSEKNRAENVMIVDLLRNDIGKICKYGSVKVDDLFGIEKYESLFQLVSTVEGKLKKDISVGDIIKNIFPCGSVTGAPKISTMKIIKELENENREIYTGSIGLIDKNKTVFNVAIRTLEIEKQSGAGKVGLGSGIVWDSNAKNEYDEIILKSKFLTSPQKSFELIETMLVENGRVIFLNDHIERLKSSAKFFLFYFREEKIIKRLKKTVEQKCKSGKHKVRLTLNKWGRIDVSVQKIPPLPGSIKIIISEKHTDSTNTFQYFKTTNRKLYNEEREKYSAQGFYDVIFFNERNELAEGSITNIFLRKGDVWFTPLLSSGILNGIYRNYFLTNRNDVKESTITLEDLLSTDEIKLVNSVRKEIKVEQLYYGNEFVEFT